MTAASIIAVRGKRPGGYRSRNRICRVVETVDKVKSERQYDNDDNDQ